MEDLLIEEGKNQFLRLPREAGSGYSYEQKMILNNQPSGLLSLHTSETAEGCFYDYNISGLVALSESREEGLQGGFLRTILFRLDSLAEVLAEFMLQPGHLDLSEKRIFLRRETGQVLFLYYPDKKETFQESIQTLMEYFLKRMNPQEEREVLLLYGLYSKAREPHVTLSTLADYWRENAGEETEFSPEEPGIPDEDTREIFRELGLQEPVRQEKENAKEKEKGLLRTPRISPEPGDPGPSASCCREVIYEGEEKEAEKLFRKLGSLLKEYGFEIAVGLIVLLGTVLILLR